MAGRKQGYDPIAPQSPFVRDLAEFCDSLASHLVGVKLEHCVGFEVHRYAKRIVHLREGELPQTEWGSRLHIKYYVGAEVLEHLVKISTQPTPPIGFTFEKDELFRFAPGELPSTVICVEMEGAVQADWLGIVEKHYPKQENGRD